MPNEGASSAGRQAGVASRQMIWPRLLHGVDLAAQLCAAMVRRGRDPLGSRAQIDEARERSADHVRSSPQMIQSQPRDGELAEAARTTQHVLVTHMTERSVPLSAS